MTGDLFEVGEAFLHHRCCSNGAKVWLSSRCLREPRWRSRAKEGKGGELYNTGPWRWLRTWLHWQCKMMMWFNVVRSTGTVQKCRGYSQERWDTHLSSHSPRISEISVLGNFWLVVTLSWFLVNYVDYNIGTTSPIFRFIKVNLSYN